MKKKLSVAIAFVAFSSATFGQVFMANKCEISFFSRTPVEDIAATNKEAHPFLNTATGSFQIKIGIIFFKFAKPLMEEHFNENYMETEKYPYAIFKGKINEKVDYTKDGDYNVTVTGTLSLHGVDQERTIPGVITVKGGQIMISSTFNIKFDDYKIVIPSLQRGIIPDNTDVKINATLDPLKK